MRRDLAVSVPLLFRRGAIDGIPNLTPFYENAKFSSRVLLKIKNLYAWEYGSSLPDLEG